MFSVQNILYKCLDAVGIQIIGLGLEFGHILSKIDVTHGRAILSFHAEEF
jgi:hypothetical protein